MAMKITAGMGSIDDYIPYSRAGADEVFIGFVPEKWQERYGLSVPLNRREVCFSNVQAGSFSELEILAEMKKEYGTAVTIAFNGLSFEPEMYGCAAGIMMDCADMGFDSVIIADPGLLYYLNRRKLTDRLHIHISGEIGEMNHFCMGELAEMGAERIIFHRRVQVRTIHRCIRRYFAEYSGDAGRIREFEAFALNENCHYSGAFCNTVHSDELVPMCRMPYRVIPVPESADIFSAEEDTERTCDGVTGFDHDYYGIENLELLEEAGITHLKIVGRGLASDYMVKCIGSMRRRLNEIKA